MSKAAGRLAIIAGGGRLPHHVAEAAAAAGENPFIITLTGEADGDWSAFEHLSLSVGDFAGVTTAFRDRGVDRVVLSGGVRRRPDWRGIRPTLAFLFRMPSVVSTLIKGGDDTVLKMVIELIESAGARVVGVQEILPSLLAAIGPVGAVAPDEAALADMKAAAEAATALGRLDIGQGAIAVGGRVVALEGPEGTDAMLARVAGLKAEGRISARRRGVLVKLCKPQQDLRADLPSIGPATLENAHAAGLAGVAVEAGRALILERRAVIETADRLGLFLVGMEREMDR